MSIANSMICPGEKVDRVVLENVNGQEYCLDKTNALEVIINRLPKEAVVYLRADPSVKAKVVKAAEAVTKKFLEATAKGNFLFCLR